MRSHNGNGRMRAPAPRALDPARQIIKIASSSAPGNTPAGLEIGELGIDIAATPRLWVGCPTAIDASGLLRLHVADPAAGFLPLTGGTLTGPGNLTLHDGTLTVSGGTPMIVWDKTGTDPFQWKLYAATSTITLAVDSDVLFYINRVQVPPVTGPVRADIRLTGSIWATGAGSFTGLNTDTFFDAYGLASFRGPISKMYYGIDVGDKQPSHGVNAGLPLLNFTQPAPITGANAVLGEIWAYGPAGIDNTPLGAVPAIGPGQRIQAAAIRFLSTQGWERDTTIDYGVDPPVMTSRVDELGAEIAFFVSRNGGPSTYRAMTLGQDGSLEVLGNVTASGSLLTSDPALKEISPAPTGALAKVCELPVIDFRWKHGRDSKLHRGFSADDVMRVMGEDSGCSATGAYSLADMNAMLWRAVQELSAKVQELEQRMH